MRFRDIAVSGLLATALTAQVEGDPRQKMQEILDRVATDMQQIDTWLRETGRPEDARRIDRILQSVGESQKRVVKGIEDLLKEAEKAGGC